MKNYVSILTLVLASCTGISSHETYPSIKIECEISNNSNSKPCKIANMNEWTKDEKEQQMGFIYLFTEDAYRDCGKAKYWFERSAKANNAEALNNLGMIYFMGCDVEKNYSVAADYFLKASKFGSKQANANLGALYREGGNGIQKDLDKALYWFNLAINDTPARAYDGIASIYIDRKDYDKAYDHLLNAAKLGSIKSQYNLAYMYDEGIYINKDKEKAMYWYKQAADRGHSSAKKNLQILLEEINYKKL